MINAVHFFIVVIPEWLPCSFFRKKYGHRSHHIDLQNSDRPINVGFYPDVVVWTEFDMLFFMLTLLN